MLRHVYRIDYRYFFVSFGRIIDFRNDSKYSLYFKLFNQGARQF